MFEQFVTRANICQYHESETVGTFSAKFELSWIPCWTPPRYAEKKIFKAVFGWLSIMSKLPGKYSYQNPEKNSNKNRGNRDISCKLSSLPICSMYSIFTYIWVIYGVNVGKYSIHGAYGLSLIMYGSLALIPQANKQHCPKFP